MSSETKWTPCKVVDGYKVEPCSMLGKAYDMSPTRKARGLFHQVRARVLEPNSPISRELFILKSGEYVIGGIVLNFCPFCGTRIETQSRESALASARGES